MALSPSWVNQLPKDLPDPEIRLLLACSRPRLDEATREEIRQRAKGVEHWDRFYRLSVCHALQHLVHRALSECRADQVPAALADAMRRDVHANAIRNITLTQELLRLLQLFRSHDIPVIPYKGPVQAEPIYGATPLRRFDDLDFIIRPRDMFKVQRMLLENGYQTSGKPLKLKNKTAQLPRDQYEATYMRTRGSLNIEMHWQLLRRHSECGFDADYIWSHARPAVFRNVPILDFPPEFKLLMMSIHNEKHHWRLLKFIADVAWMLEHQKNLDLDRALDLAEGLDRMEAMLKTLYLARVLFSAPLNARARQLIQERPRLELESALLRYQIFREGFRLPGFSKWKSILAGEREHFSSEPDASFKTYLAVMLTPQYVDRNRIPVRLGGRWEWVYSVTRTIRFIKYWTYLHPRRRRRLVDFDK